nr:cytokine receptor common subunit beta isoform X1 [Pelodiscus sinensis]XP_014434403.1 cytokine receptor common subunit beta isoform X1 [Pelodiscus sinensis]|eukprot:XP_006133861.1 cytokine receptor common subunit beta isoform X1 [Pelodiscus sinensis]
MQTFCRALLALCWAFGRGESRESLPMQSLHCYNDYTSQTTCTWQECGAARHFLSVTLHHKDNIKEISTPIPCEPQGANGFPVCQDSCICWSCPRNSTSFAVGVNDYYSFKPSRLLQANLSISPFQNVQPLPPQKLQINVTEEGDFFLAWEAAGGRKGSHWQHHALEFEVAYKREWESWEKSSSVSVASSCHCLLRRDALVPGSTYLARVRAKPSQSGGWSGQPSEWSTAVSWKSQEGDEAQPKNLRCLFNGVDQLTCSWEVRREVASSVLFTLFYRATPASQETECSPVHEEELPHSPYLFQSCEINVTNGNSLSQYLITVRPKEEEKLIAAYKNIKPLAPVNVTVKNMKDEDYELRWTKQALSFDHIIQIYEFQYWKIGDSEENVRWANISNESPIIFTLPMLEPSTYYKGKMRARVHAYSSYKGPWSEWSEECTWKTESVPSPLILQLLIPVVTIMLITFAWCGYRSLLRVKNKWEEKIPNPSKSQLFQSFLKKAPLVMGGFGKQSHSEKTDQASSIQVLEGLMKVSSAELPGAMDERMKCFLSALDSENPYQTLETAAPAPPPSAPAGCRSSQATSQLVMPAMLPCRSSAEIPASQAPMSCFDFNGPYLHLPHECSLPDIPQHSDAAPFLSRGRPVSLEYVSLPEGSNSQTPLAGEARGAAQLRPVSRPAQEEIKQPPAGGQEGPQGQCRGTGEAVQGDAEGQRSLTAATPNNSCQKWPMGYVTTEGLSLMPAGDSAHLSPAQAPPEGMLSAVGVLMSSPCLPHATEHTPSPERAPEHPVAIQVPPPASATPEFGSYVMFPKAPHGIPEPSNVSSPILLEEVDFPKEESVQEGHVVMFNPDGTEPVFLRQVGEYCFFPGCKPEEKTSMGEKSLLADQTSEAKQAFGKLPCDGESDSGKREPALQMQAIQLFKTRKFGDYIALP